MNRPTSNAKRGGARGGARGGGRGGGARRQQNVNVPEETRIRVSKLIEQFHHSDDKVFTFQEELSNVERASVHLLCRRMGMKSKSSGKGSKRRISVFKTKKKLNNVNINAENIPKLILSEDAQEVLQELFTCYPPDDGEVDQVVKQVVADKLEVKNDEVRMNREYFFCKPQLSKKQISKKLKSFSEQIESRPELKEITEKRSKLPIASYRDTITSTIQSSQVVLICGETGCGKTTQVPQFILDSMWTKRKACKLVCTQPRRISATSVAERIASERGQDVGDDVGYKIRLESKGGQHSSIVFCTNGILLRVLVSKGKGEVMTESSHQTNDEVSDITHIVVDEIHERDRYSDFMLAILRDMLPAYPHLRLILMSATIDAERFSQYFSGCPIIRVPGFTHPVKSFYLEDVLSILNSGKDNYAGGTSSNELTEGHVLTDLTEESRDALDEAISLAWSSNEFDFLLDLIKSEGTSRTFNYQHSSTGLTPLMVLAGKGKVGDVCMLLSLGADSSIKANDGSTAFQLAEQEKQEEAAKILKGHVNKALLNTDEQQRLLEKYVATSNTEFIDVVLMENLLMRLCTDSKDGGILIFLPGWDAINRTREALCENPYFRDASKFVIRSLHSMVPSSEQRMVFDRPPPGCRKIVLSTNIAETSVTIDDIVYVIDSGRMKEKSYDPYSNVSTLHSAWISKASAKQREGRAGRCQPGTCYHLYSKARAISLPDFQVPEIKRMPIEELCLQVKLIDPTYKIEDFLCKLLDPPVFETIQNAITVLREIGALTVEEKLTELGEKLGSLPVHPLTSKMLFIAILLNCLEPALTLACASDYRDPFTIPLPQFKKKALEAKKELASMYGGYSDQLAVVAAYEGWNNAKERGQEGRFCAQYFVSASVMKMLSGMRKQLRNELIRNGFVQEDVSNCSRNARDTGILHAVLVAGSYPMIGRLLPPYKSGGRSTIEISSGDKVSLFAESANTGLSFEGCPLVVYDEVTRGDSGTHIKNCSVIGPLQLLLLATEIAVASGKDIGGSDEDSDNDSDEDGDEEKSCDENEKPIKFGEQPADKTMSSPDKIVTVVIDRWISFKMTALHIAQIYCLRERLSAAILFKATRPRKALSAHLELSIHAIACILSSDGLSGTEMASMDDTTKVESSARGKMVANQNQNSLLKSVTSLHLGSVPPPNPISVNPNQRHRSRKAKANLANPFGAVEGFKRQRGNGTR